MTVASLALRPAWTAARRGAVPSQPAAASATGFRPVLSPGLAGCELRHLGQHSLDLRVEFGCDLVLGLRRCVEAQELGAAAHDGEDVTDGVGVAGHRAAPHRCLEGVEA